MIINTRYKQFHQNKKTKKQTTKNKKRHAACKLVIVCFPSSKCIRYYLHDYNLEQTKQDPMGNNFAQKLMDKTGMKGLPFSS